MMFNKKKDPGSPASTVPLDALGEDPVLEDMSIDELIDYKLRIDEQIEIWRQEKVAAHAVYTRKLEAWHIEQKLKAAGLEWINVEPGQARLRLRGK